MASVSTAFQEDYWKNFQLTETDTEFLYNHLLELETPLETRDLLSALVRERIQVERKTIEERRTSSGDLYQPKGTYQIDQALVFPALNWIPGKVISIREGQNPELGEFGVIEVQLDNGDRREFATGLEEHILNSPPKFSEENPALDEKYVLQEYAEELTAYLDEDLETNPDFVRIARKWFPRALLVEVSEGHLNLAEAVLDMAGGGPLPTTELLSQIELDANVNYNLLEFSLDQALEEDARFDEVGPAGDVLWFLNRLEPEEVLRTPMHLRYDDIDYDRAELTEEMKALELELDDELSDQVSDFPKSKSVEVRLIYPHLRAGTIPLSNRVRHLFPTAYEAPRIRFQLVDGKSGETFPAWVVREKGYVFGLKDWYEKNEFIPGSKFEVKQSKNPGEVIIQPSSQRTSREWIRTVLVGSDGGVVYAMLKQLIPGQVDPRMGIAIPDHESLDTVWNQPRSKQPPFEQTVVNTVKELAKLNPQSHVHASELYAAVNMVRRCPPGPIFGLLASRPWFIHVGDLHFRLNDQDI